MKKNKFLPILIIIFLLFASAAFLNFETASRINPNTDFVKKPSVIFDVIQKKKQFNKFDNFRLFNISSSTNNTLKQYADSYTILNLYNVEYNKLYKQKPDFISIKIPLENNKYILAELEKVDILPTNFSLKNLYNNRYSMIKDNEGIYYQGIISGDNNSIAGISFFKNEVIGLFSNSEGNYVLGNLKDGKSSNNSEYIIYNDKDLKITNKFKCLVDDSNESRLNKGLTRDFSNIKNSLKTKPYSDNPTQDSVRIYFVTDYDMFQRWGTNGIVTFVTGMFNVVSLIYRNESIPLALAPTLGYYSQPDPYYSMTNSVDVLYAFGNNTRDNFNGDLAHLLSTRDAGMGGIAWINILCQSFNPNDTSGRFAFSNIDPIYNQLPTYSWTINVVAHEMGHNFASRHTHACVWPIAFGVYGAIDSCYYAEGGCFYQLRPNYNGTIMSYCHLNGYINLAGGFGQYPGDTLREGYRLAKCLDNSLNSSELPVTFNLLQNYPNPFNPGTYMHFALPQDAFVTISVYDINGRFITSLNDHKFYNAGYQTVYFDASGLNLASGVYLYRLEAFSDKTKVFSQFKKMIFLK
jgi:hypothetical protein